MDQQNPQNPTQNPSEKEETVEETLERNKRDALRLARDIWKVVTTPDFMKIDPEVRMKTVQEKVPEFYRAYPSVVRWMVRDLKYSEKAFSEYLNMLVRPGPTPEPGKGYLEYIRKQAEYSRILYKHSVPHWDTKTAAAIFKREYDAMVKTYKDMKKEEEGLKSEFEEEKRKHKQEKISEIIDFIKNAKSGGGEANAERTKQILAEKINRVANIVDYRMKQAEEMQRQINDGGMGAGGAGADEMPQDIADSLKEGGAPIVREVDPQPPSAEELERLEARLRSQKELEQQAIEKRTNRDESFLPQPHPPQQQIRRRNRGGRKNTRNKH